MMCLDEWDETILTNCGRFHTEPRRGAHKQIGNFVKRARLGVDIAEIDCTIEHIQRSRLGIRRDDREYMFLLYQKTGETAVLHNQREEVLKSGECLLLDSTKTATMGFSGQHASFFSVHLPRGLFLDERGFFPAAGRKIGGGHALHGSLNTVLFSDDAQGEGDFSADYLFDFIRMIFGTESGTVEASRFRNRDDLFRYVQDRIDRKLTDASFTIDCLARDVGRSRRQLQRDFCDNGTSFTRQVQQRRLMFVRSRLERNVRLGMRTPISEIAFQSGFNDLSHFNRLFRKHHGLSPREFCSQMAATGAAAETQH
ncbi:helix-turn-helix domain-containing protein [Microbulbifer sp. S227A]|uniref:helix-turn-helix domain-containing protein n=1 Tax=Microbulbifer sp. S227A TaxID=3415131 RepID=UPI003C7C9CEC